MRRYGGREEWREAQRLVRILRNPGTGFAGHARQVNRHFLSGKLAQSLSQKKSQFPAFFSPLCPGRSLGNFPPPGLAKTVEFRADGMSLKGFSISGQISLTSTNLTLFDVTTSRTFFVEWIFFSLVRKRKSPVECFEPPPPPSCSDSQIN